MKKFSLILVTLILGFIFFGKNAHASDIQEFFYIQTSQSNSITTGNATSVQNTVNEIKTTGDCNCTPTPTKPTPIPTTSNPTPTNTQGDSNSGGNSNGGSSSTNSAPTKAVLGLSTTASSDANQKEALLFIFSLSMLTAGALILRKNV